MSKNHNTTTYISNNEQQTQDIGARIVRECLSHNKRIFALCGNLGAGKTQFTKGVAQYLGAKHTVNSPTFLIMKKYPINHSTILFLYHFDWYRVHTKQDIQALGWDEIIKNPANVVVIEWADNIKNLLPQSAVIIHFESTGECTRKIQVST